MKKSELQKLDRTSPQYVIAHAAVAAKRGRGPSVAFEGIKNPAQALKAAHATIALEAPLRELAKNEQLTFRDLEQFARAGFVNPLHVAACLLEYAESGASVSDRVVIRLIDEMRPLDPSLAAILRRSARRGMLDQERRHQTKAATEYANVLAAL